MTLSITSAAGLLESVLSTLDAERLVAQFQTNDGLVELVAVPNDTVRVLVNGVPVLQWQD